MKKPAKRKLKKINISLPEREAEMLSRYAAENGVARAVAIRRILREHLRDYAVTCASKTDEKQLGLFDSVQIDIFNNTMKVNRE